MITLINRFSKYSIVILGFLAITLSYAQEERAEDISILDVDANGEVDALTDGLLLLRSMFGLADDVLTTGVISSDATVSDATAIDSYITSMKKTTYGKLNSSGEAGPAGPQGEKGDKGDTGATGAKGDTGSQGVAGTNGSDGSKGDTGDAGAKGDTGPQGDTGPVGPAGADGSDGADGPQGDTGPVGPQGDVGPVGPQGEQGAKGDWGYDANSGKWKLEAASLFSEQTGGAFSIYTRTENDLDYPVSVSLTNGWVVNAPSLLKKLGAILRININSYDGFQFGELTSTAAEFNSAIQWSSYFNGPDNAGGGRLRGWFNELFRWDYVTVRSYGDPLDYVVYKIQHPLDPELENENDLPVSIYESAPLFWKNPSAPSSSNKAFIEIPVKPISYGDVNSDTFDNGDLYIISFSRRGVRGPANLSMLGAKSTPQIIELTTAIEEQQTLIKQLQKDVEWLKKNTVEIDKS